GRSAKGWSASQAVQELTGPAFSDLTIKVRHLDGREEVIRIVRQEIHVPTVRGWRRSGRDGSWDYLLDPAAAIGYVRITSFTADTAQELDKAVSSLLGRNLKALILDLRTNPGGLMSSAVEVVDRFIEQGTIVSTRGAHSEDQVQKAHPENTYPRFILVVLIDQGSASGAEIVAGALQDHNRAVIVGRRSWGKGSVQRLIRLPESEAALKLTTDYYYLPNGRCVHRLGDAETWGVSPDIEESLDPDKVTELRSYMNHLTIDALTQAAQNGRANGDPNAPASPGEIAAGPADSATVVAAVAEKLLVLDDQLAQALKQCKGLLRTRPTLPGLAESFGQAKPAAEPDQPEEPQTK
ncbi:MAG: hypothetical protein JW810_03935, partial [Sedimentisphaerales bacterium]|nr:hypothetical protein [Sedimentisphaerales bacterium]